LKESIMCGGKGDNKLDSGGKQQQEKIKLNQNSARNRIPERTEKSSWKETKNMS